MARKTIFLFIFFCFLLILLPFLVSAECKCDTETISSSGNNTKALKFKLVAILSILIAGAFGVSIPIFGKNKSTFHPENSIFFIIKAFAAGVILATGFVHILPDAYESLTGPCLSPKPWQDFPFTGFVAMVSAILTMMIDAFATSFYQRSHFSKALPVNDDEKEMHAGHEGHVRVHTHATHGHAHGSAFESSDASGSGTSDLFRRRIVSQVLIAVSWSFTSPVFLCVLPCILIHWFVHFYYTILVVSKHK